MSEYSELQSFLKDKKYIPMDWPRDDYKPGIILEKESHDIVFRGERCFPSSEFPRLHGNLSDEQLVKTVARDYGVGLEVAMDKIQRLSQIAGIPMPDNVKAEFNKAVESAVVLNLQNVTSEYIEKGLLSTYIEEELKPESPCFKGIEKSSPCLVLQEVLKTDNLQYTFYKTGKGNLGMVIGWFGINFRAGVTTESEKAFVLTITTPQYFAFKKPIEVIVKKGRVKTYAMVPPPIETKEIVDPEEILGNNLYWSTK